MLILTKTITKINLLSQKTNANKQIKLANIKGKIEEILHSPDLTETIISNFLMYCDQYLNDKEFTYKRISLFGFLTSRAEDFLRSLKKEIHRNIIFLFLDKLKQITTDADITQQLNDIISLVKDRNYSAILAKCNDIKLTDLNKMEAFKFLFQWTIEHLELQINLPDNPRVYNGNSITKILDEKFDQEILDLNQLRRLMQKQNDGEIISFIFVVDLNKNVLFSLGADDAYHLNILNGKAAYSAGEFYMRKTKNGIELTILNNKSGYYRPDTTFLEPLKQWFKENGFIVDKVLLKDERLQLARDYFQYKMAM